MKKIWLLGDSIRMSYAGDVKALLEGHAEVFFTDDNNCFARHTLWHLDSINAAFGKPDIVHWNNGIWDVWHHREDSPAFSSPDEYLRDMTHIYNRLHAMGARVIFASTTPVHPDFENVRNDEVRFYNGIMAAFCRFNGLPVNDLHGLVASSPAYLADDMLHLSELGVKAAAKQTAGILEDML